MMDWLKHKLEARLLGEISINLRYADDNTVRTELKILFFSLPKNQDTFVINKKCEI